jgi:glycyl-tRNA synthetase beta chain
MRWADGDEEFVRPVHWVVLLFGDQVIECTILGIKAGNRSYGHRFHHPEPILISEPKNYLTHLRQGKVIADFDERRNTICRQIEQLTQQVSGRAVIDNALLNEVTALVEWPVALMGNFEARFLDIPSEALITTMQDNQKYFPIVDAEGTLLPSFITVSNIESKNPSAIRTGNERVIRPRFSDAEFFWQQDLKTPLESHLEALKKMVFQKKLGSLFDKTERVAKLSRTIAELSDYDADKAERAARLSKCDLLTNMVQEFPALQGTMGYYYAQRAGEVEEIANALKEQYQPRFAGDQIPSSVSGKILALAERIDTLLGIFAIGQTPTGAKDPFALRRSALGIVRILIESDWNLDLRELLHQAALHFAPDIKAYAAIDSVFDFVVERMRGYYAELGFPTDVFEAVLECSPTSPVDFDKRIRAVSAFRERAEAVSLAAANKRIRNILKKSPLSGSTEIDEELLQDVSEQKLARNLSELSTTVIPMTDQGDYAAALSCLASLREPVDRFFDDVMVMVEDDALKNNRIALLSQLSALFLRIADFSRLQS